MAKWQNAPLANAASPSDRARGKSPMATLTSGGNAPAGMSSPGNLDLNARKVFNDPAGDYRTENSISIGTDQGEVLIPTVVNGQQLSEADAIKHFEQTGEHLGVFKTPDDANAYAVTLHQRQGEKYSPKKAAVPKWQSAPLAKPADAAAKPATGLMENIGAGIDEGANALLGAPVDIPVYVGNRLINATNSGIEMFGGGRPVPNIPEDLPGSSQGFEKVQAGLGFTPPSAVEPADEGQRLARSASGAVTMAAVPETLALKTSQAITTLPRALQSLSPSLSALFGGSRTGAEFARSMVTNAAVGAGAQGAMDAAPEPLKPFAALAGGVVAGTATHALGTLPALARGAVKVAGDYAAPLTQAGRERVAGTTLRDAATDPNAVMENLDAAPAPLVSGSQPTTFQQTGDMGLGALERSAATKNPAEFNQRRADQNAARVTALENVQPIGAPEQVVTALRSHLDEIQKQADADIAAATKSGDETLAAANKSSTGAVNAATADAQAAAGALGPGVVPEVAGGQMREAVEAARATAKARERQLWDAVDPDGTLALSAANTKSGAARIRNEMPVSAKPMSGEESEIFSVLQRYGDDVPFSEMTALQSRLKTEMRNERLANGESPAYRRMSQLNTAVQNDLESAIAGKVETENAAVASGAMSTEQTAAYRIEQWQNEWRQRQAEARAVDVVGAGGNGGMGATSISSPRGTAGEAGIGSGNSKSDPRLSADGGANLDQSALDRLNTARAATKTRAETFDNSTLAPIRKRPGTTSPYDMPAAAVPGKIFFAGAKSPEAISTFRNAVGDATALPVLRDYAVDRLRKAAENADGTVDHGRATSWLRQHDDALRQFPELAQAIRRALTASERAAEVATTQKGVLRGAEREVSEQTAAAAKAAKQKVDEAQAGIIGRILGVSDPQDVTRAVGSIFGRQDAVKQMARLKDAIGSNKDAAEGLRKAVADYLVDRFVGNTEAATSGLGTMKSDQFQSFIAQNKRALELAGFDAKDLQLMDDIAADLQQANRSVAAVKLPGGSNTPQDVLATNAADTKTSMLSKIALAAAGGGAGVGWLAGGIPGVAATVAIGLVGALRQQGLASIDDLIKDAMLNPARARQLLKKARTPEAIKEVAVNLGQMYRRAALVSTATANAN